MPKKTQAYRVCRIPKGQGKFRTIYVPSRHYKERMRRMIPILTLLSIQLDRERVCHGFMPYRSPVTNALQHIGFAFTLSFDLSNFFDNVTRQHLLNLPDPLVKVPDSVIDLCLVENKTPQGFPTSPQLANIALSWLDRAILEELNATGQMVSYTRYADDLVFSFNTYELRGVLQDIIPRLCQIWGFQINPSKTSFHTARRGFRPVTGVHVGPDGIRPPRRILRRCRNAKHKGRQYQARGLEQWAQLRRPANSRILEVAYATLARRMRIYEDKPTDEHLDDLTLASQFVQLLERERDIANELYQRANAGNPRPPRTSPPATVAPPA